MTGERLTREQVVNDIARKLWQIGNERIGHRPWELVAVVYVSEAEQVADGVVLPILQASYAREDELQRLSDGRWSKARDWPKTTPSGHTYEIPTTYEQLKARHVDAAQALIEGWDADECPPEPTWEMVGLAHGRIAELEAALAAAQELIRPLADTLSDWSMNASLPDDLEHHHGISEAARANAGFLASTNELIRKARTVLEAS